jgi:hypothetical protein
MIKGGGEYSTLNHPKREKGRGVQSDDEKRI